MGTASLPLKGTHSRAPSRAPSHPLLPPLPSRAAPARTRVAAGSSHSRGASLSASPRSQTSAGDSPRFVAQEMLLEAEAEAEAAAGAARIALDREVCPHRLSSGRHEWRKRGFFQETVAV